MAAKGVTDLDLIQMHHPLDEYCDFKPKLPILKVFAAIPTGMRLLFSPRLEASGFKLGEEIFGAGF
jgi:hypothetical protein